MIHSTTTSGKFRRLVRKLRPMLGEVPCAVETVAVGLLERLWHVAISGAFRGDIGRFDDEEIAEMVGWHGDATALVELLVEEHWLDRDPTHRLLIHDWHEHAPRHVKANAKKQGGILTLTGARKEPPSDEDDAYSVGKEPPKGAKGVTPNLTKPNQTKPSPPAPPPALNGGDRDLGQAWKGVEADLLSLGVRMAPQAVDAAISNGCSADDAIAVIAFWRLNTGAWEAGALYSRLLVLRPDQDCSELWPEKSTKFQAAERRETVSKNHAGIVAERLESERRREADIAAGESLESRFGRELDAMARESVVELIREKLPDESALLLRRMPEKGPTTGILREALLGYLDATSKRRPAPSAP